MRMFGKLAVLGAAIYAGAATNVACVGNSITKGYGLGWQEDYPYQLQQIMGSDYAVTNFGVSSMTFAGPTIKSGENRSSYWSTDKFKAALASSPDIVVIELGTNDSKYFMQNYSDQGIYNYNYGQCEKSQLYADYGALVDTFAHVESAPEIFATLQPYSNNVSWAITDTAIVNQINPIIKDVATEKGVNIIDLHTLFQTPAWYLEDSVHPNVSGAQELAKIVNKYITLAKPAAVQEKATVRVKDTGYGFRWYKDGALIEGATEATLSISEKGTYRALVKIESDNDSWLLTDNITVTDLGAGDEPTPGENPTGFARKGYPTVEKTDVKVKGQRFDVKGRSVKKTARNLR